LWDRVPLGDSPAPASRPGGTVSKKATTADGNDSVLEKVAAMRPPYDEMGARLHALIRQAAPALQPRLWYGMPAYAKDGKVVCFFRADRYMTFGLSDNANLTPEEGATHRLLQHAGYFPAPDA